MRSTQLESNHRRRTRRKTLPTLTGPDHARAELFRTPNSARKTKHTPPQNTQKHTQGSLRRIARNLPLLPRKAGFETSRDRLTEAPAQGVARAHLGGGREGSGSLAADGAGGPGASGALGARVGPGGVPRAGGRNVNGEMDSSLSLSLFRVLCP